MNQAIKKQLKHKSPKNQLLVLAAKAYAYLYPMAKRWTHHFHGGVFPKYNKELSNRHPLEDGFIPPELILPLQQHVGIEAIPLVQAGDKVLKNQCIADTPKGLSAPIHAPTSGTIIAIEPRMTPHISGIPAMCLVLKPDFEDTQIHNSLKVSGETPDSPEALKAIIHKAGIVGMGGAGFPTFAKIPNEKGKIHTLMINGAECEPFITCDDLLMQTQAEEIVQGALMVVQALGAKKVLCGIENNKPKAIKAMQKAAQGTLIKVMSVPTVYPMGGQKQLTQELTGLETPAHIHAVDIGLLMMNVATYVAIYQSIKNGNPLIKRYVTVSGMGLEKPYNINALIGTPFQILAEKAQPKSDLDYPLIMGGPMMGIKMPSNEVPIVKTTNCVLANPPEPIAEALPCIRCGECMDACPINLLPQQMYWYSRSEEYDKVENLKVFDCIECGCCSFVCPSHIPLVQYYRHSKAAIKTLKIEEKATELAKERHEAKLARMAAEKAEKAARMKAKKEAVKQQAAAKANATQDLNSEQAPAKKPAAARAAAAKKAAAKKASSQSNKTASTDSTEPTPKLSARDKAIATAKARAAAKKQKENTPSNSAERLTTKTAETAETAETADTAKTTQVKPEISKEDKRKAAMAAAKARAAAKKATKPNSTETSKPDNS